MKAYHRRRDFANGLISPDDGIRHACLTDILCTPIYDTGWQWRPMARRGAPELGDVARLHAVDE